MIEVLLMDLGVGNMLSVQRGFERIGCSVRRSTEPSHLRDASALVLPGVGNWRWFAEALMPHMEEFRDAVLEGIPTLGICLGMQILYERSEEGAGSGLSIFEGAVERIQTTEKVPHIGWNDVEIVGYHEILEGIPQGADFYFVHSYYRACEGKGSEIGITHYGNPFVSIVGNGNVIGTQFHPEKSGAIGKQLLVNFVSMVKR